MVSPPRLETATIGFTDRCTIKCAVAVSVIKINKVNHLQTTKVKQTYDNFHKSVDMRTEPMGTKDRMLAVPFVTVRMR